MKRCPQCNRVESEEALKFCRVDGATLINDPSSMGESGTAQFGSAANLNEVHTSIFPHRTDANINRGTAPTTVLPPTSQSTTTSDLSKPRSRRTAIMIAVIVTVVLAAASAGVVNSYRSRNSNANSIQSIAVMPFVNESGNADLEYLSDGMTETLINGL